MSQFKEKLEKIGIKYSGSRTDNLTNSQNSYQYLPYFHNSHYVIVHKSIIKKLFKKYNYFLFYMNLKVLKNKFSFTLYYLIIKFK